jgi:predicted amidohydrolase YtcJ
MLARISPSAVDWTVATYDPMHHMHAALNRQKWDANDPDQRLTLEEVILGYTRDAAYAEFKENEKGQVREDFLADLVLFSHDLFALNPEDILTASAALTLVNGKVVFETQVQ